MVCGVPPLQPCLFPFPFLSGEQRLAHQCLGELVPKWGCARALYFFCCEGLGKLQWCFLQSQCSSKSAKFVVNEQDRVKKLEFLSTVVCGFQEMSVLCWLMGSLPSKS